MTDSSNKENISEGTYLLDLESAAEMARLLSQDLIITKAMEDLFPEHINITSLHNVLDIACGPGGWALEVAYEYPAINVVGVDVSQPMLQYATMRAETQRLSNASFRQMNVLARLDFPDESFDLVNARFIAGFVPRGFWPKVLQECYRVTRPGGIVCLTEPEMNFSTSPAFVEMAVLGTQAMKSAGLGFSLDGHQINITPMLGRLLREAGFQDIQKKAHVIDFSFGEKAHEGFYQNYVAGAQLARPFLLKKSDATPEKLDQLYQDMLKEMTQEDFHALWFLLSAWGKKPGA